VWNTCNVAKAHTSAMCYMEIRDVKGENHSSIAIGFSLTEL
jgi:hypothetical protein